MAASRRRRAGGAGSGGMACARRGSARSTAVHAAPARNNRRESRERAVQQTNRRYSRSGDSATSARAKCGHRVLPPFVRFSAVFAGRARTALCAAVDDPRPLAALAPGTAHHHPTRSSRTPRAPDAGFSFRFITYRLLMIVNFAWLVNIHVSGAVDALASHDACEVGDVRVAACARINQGPSDCNIAALITRCDCDVHSEGTVQCAKQT